MWSVRHRVRMAGILFVPIRSLPRYAAENLAPYAAIPFVISASAATATAKRASSGLGMSITANKTVVTSREAWFRHMMMQTKADFDATTKKSRGPKDKTAGDSNLDYFNRSFELFHRPPNRERCRAIGL